MFFTSYLLYLFSMPSSILGCLASSLEDSLKMFQLQAFACKKDPMKWCFQRACRLLYVPLKLLKTRSRRGITI